MVGGVMIDEDTLERWGRDSGSMSIAESADAIQLLIEELRWLRASLVAHGALPYEEQKAKREAATEERYRRTAEQRRAECPVSEAKLFETFVRIAMTHYMGFQPEAAGDSAFIFAQRALSGFYTGRTYWSPGTPGQVVTIAEVKS
jgi:hypothetical protein